MKQYLVRKRKGREKDGLSQPSLLSGPIISLRATRVLLALILE